MLSYYYPPLVGIASERAAAFARHLPDVGWNPVVIAPREGFYHRGEGQEAGARSVVRTRNPELSRLLRRWFGVVTGAPAYDGGLIVPISTSAVGIRLRRLAREALYVPDGQFGWIPFAGRAAAREVARLPGCTVLFSSSVPFSAHLAAMWARHHKSTPWVAEFRDPWSEGHPDLLPSFQMRRRLDRAVHRQILKRATRIVVVSAGLRDRLLEAFPELDPARVDIVMNGFEPGAVGTPPAPTQPLRLLYAGSVAQGEDVGPILQAVGRVHERSPGRVRLAVVGPPSPWRESPASGGPWLELKGLHTPAQARSHMRNASALVLLQSHPAYAATIPGKLFEYVGARRPILAAVPDSWSIVGLLRKHSDLRLVANLSAVGLTYEIERLLSEHTAGELQPPRVPEEIVRPLERCEQAKRLATVFSRAVDA